MASYTIEDIELIRRKSGISYQEAVALLDYHNGNVARALVDLERNGRIKPEAEQARPKRETTGRSQGRRGLMGVISRLYQARVKVRKGNTSILNLSLLFSLLALLISPHLVLVGVILMLILGYKVSFERHDPDFASDNLEKMVRNAAQNVKESVSSMAQEFTAATDNDASAAEAAPKAEAARPEPEQRSYYQANPAATTYHASYGGSAPTLQVPVQVESQDGSVSVESDKDGFTNATIE
ncbi:MAG: hypothetical protein ACI4ML_03630 [Aristaeellaceae bacterium]